MNVDPAARNLLLSLTHHMRQKAQRLLGEDATDDAPPPPDDEPRSPDHPLPLHTVERAFQLSPLEHSTVLCLLAAEVEPYFRTLIRGEQREGGRPWLELGTIAEVIELDRASLPSLFELFLPTGKLRANGLVAIDEPEGSAETPLIHLRAKIARRLLRYCLGINELPDGMRLCAEPRPILGDSLLPESERAELLSRIRYALLAARPLVVDLHGVEGVGKKFLAEGLAREIGRPILFCDVRSWDRRHLAQHVADLTREAVLADALPYLDRWDQLVDENLDDAPPPPSIDPEDPQPSSAPRRPLPPPLARFLDHHPGVVFLGSRERWPQLDRLSASVTRVSLAFPGPAQRGRLWVRCVEAAGAELAEGIDADELGRKFALDPARIVAATRSAIELRMLRRPGAQITLDRDEILEASRGQLQHELASLAVRVTKAHKWEDLVIPVEVYESLQELLSYVRHSALVYETQGFRARHSVNPGLSALFAGPPGTGKTMCASIVARELEMELFRVDLSRVVSKWIGETEKNLAKVFDEAQRSHAVILFDEADSLFAKRTEVKSSVDRYANLEVSYLLQRMEQFSGVTVLTTNFEDTIDPAFKRRITFKMRFERPDAAARAALWAKMYPPQVRLGDDVDFAEIGRRFELSGGLIRNAVIRSAFLAAAEGKPGDPSPPICQRHIVVASAREAREMGVLVPEPRRDETRPAPDAPGAAEGDLRAGLPDEPPRKPDPPGPTRPPARMVPITRPRR